MKNNEKALQEYVESVTNDFVENYVKQLDESILEMVKAFGYEEDTTDNIGAWLEKEGLNLLMDEDKKDNVSIKTIFLEDKAMKIPVGVFMVETMMDETVNLNYRFSDVFINQDFID